MRAWAFKGALDVESALSFCPNNFGEAPLEAGAQRLGTAAAISCSAPTEKSSGLVIRLMIA